MRVLLVEDDVETAAYILRGLREHGHQADHAADGQEGFFLASGSDYDVMVVDRMLPVMEGLGFVRTVRGAGAADADYFPDGASRGRRPRTGTGGRR